MKRKQSGIRIMARLIGLVKPLAGFMVLAVFLGVTGFLCAISITVVGALGLLDAAGFSGGIAVGAAFAIVAVCAVLRGLRAGYHDFLSLCRFAAGEGIL